MQSAFKRQAIAEWRDEQILEAVALVNRSVQAVRTALDEDFKNATAKEALFPRNVANARIDKLTHELLAPTVKEFLAAAGKKLGEIDPSLTAHVSSLTELDLAANMEVPALEASDENEIASEGEVLEPGELGSTRRLGRLAGKIIKGATTIAETAGAARDTLISDTMGLSERIRVTAMKRVEREWHDGANSNSVVSKLVMAIDAVSASARVSLL